MDAARTVVWLGGRFVPLEEARVSFFDAGLQHGVGLFETMVARRGRVFRLRAHLERLAASAAALRLTESLRLDALESAVQAAVVEAGSADARVRLTITGGDLSLLRAPGGPRPAPHLPTLAVVVQPQAPWPPSLHERGIRVLASDARANPAQPFEGHKTLNYWPRLSVLQDAAAAGADEALWFCTQGRLVSACVANVFLVRDGRLITPPAWSPEEPTPVRPGVTRAAVLELARAEGLPVSEEWSAVQDVLAAGELFLTNSTWGVLPVTHLERHIVGSGRPGEVTSRLRALYEAMVDDEVGTSARAPDENS